MVKPKFALNSKQLGVVIIGVILLALLMLVAHFATPAATRGMHFSLTLLIVLIGACIGALLAAMVSPFSSSEDQAFKLVAGIASVFLTAFVWKEFGPQIGQVLQSLFPSTSQAPDGPGQARAAAFVVAVFMSAFVNYVFRAYASPVLSEEVAKQLSDIRAALDKLEEQLASKRSD